MNISGEMGKGEKGNVVNLVIHNRQRSLHWWQVIVAGDKARKTKAKILRQNKREREREEEPFGSPKRPRLGVLWSSRDRKKSRSRRNDDGEVQLHAW